MNNLHDTDFYTWTERQAEKLSANKHALSATCGLSLADVDFLIEELKAMGATEYRELVNRLAVLMHHLLKWQYQPEKRGGSWENTIQYQRDDVDLVLSKNPGLMREIEEIKARAYRKARHKAAAETGLDREGFPEECPWQLDQVLDSGFWPT
jgi:uncharacterized protein DUF29